jgi:hypothetical protein
VAKDTVEDHLRIDIRKLDREGLLAEGRRISYSWVNGDSINVEAQQRRIVLRYQLLEPGGKKVQIKDPISLALTPCNYGRERPWFLCPGCGRRVAILYLGGKYFRCRRCHGLVYQTQQMGESDRDLQRIRKTRLRLGGSWSILDRFPPKPRGMRWSTYRRLELADNEAVLRRLARYGS